MFLIHIDQFGDVYIKVLEDVSITSLESLIKIEDGFLNLMFFLLRSITQWGLSSYTRNIEGFLKNVVYTNTPPYITASSLLYGASADDCKFTRSHHCFLTRDLHSWIII